MARIRPKDLRQTAPRGEPSDLVRTRVVETRARQLTRAGKLNAELSQHETERYCVLTPGDQGLLERAMTALDLSARAMQRIQRVARTLADMDGTDAIATTHLAEAIGWRQFDRPREGAQSAATRAVAGQASAA